ncbi:hypothetical protein H206_05282 [Candidatus Electrothrix aarhusensis]|uniref:Uncharacterized protein n=1 Tax=Candidatus Electrothrix aarhusensis TaxID=1859131 RepID=A0A444J524_9BACT|nr:hypothetical protein H206_05282 [Candidatus Electrothrix aarhusensis]
MDKTTVVLLGKVLPLFRAFYGRSFKKQREYFLPKSPVPTPGCHVQPGRVPTPHQKWCMVYALQGF